MLNEDLLKALEAVKTTEDQQVTPVSTAMGCDDDSNWMWG